MGLGRESLSHVRASEFRPTRRQIPLKGVQASPCSVMAGATVKCLAVAGGHQLTACLKSFFFKGPGSPPRSWDSSAPNLHGSGSPTHFFFKVLRD